MIVGGGGLKYCAVGWCALIRRVRAMSPCFGLLPSQCDVLYQIWCTYMFNVPILVGFMYPVCLLSLPPVIF